MKKSSNVTTKTKVSEFELGRVLLCAEIFKKMKEEGTDTLDKMAILLDGLTNEMEKFVEKYKNVQ